MVWIRFISAMNVDFIENIHKNGWEEAFFTRDSGLDSRPPFQEEQGARKEEQLTSREYFAALIK